MGNHEVTLGAYEGSVTKFDDGRTWQQEVADNVSKYKNFFGHDGLVTRTYRKRIQLCNRATE